MTPQPGREGKELSCMELMARLDRMGVRDRTTVHGPCRATFSTWANDTEAAWPNLIEACLAHREADLVRAAYNRAERGRDPAVGCMMNTRRLYERVNRG